MINIVVPRPVFRISHTSDLSARFEGNLRAGENDILNFPLQLVGELKALTVKNLNAVVFKGIMGGRDNYTCIRPLIHCGDTRIFSDGYQRLLSRLALAQHLRRGQAHLKSQRGI